jgi:hypothetical protein|tara:strand:+ start:213 stop:326 length:114 start_codon:yes stop_codon:yes gene_type:complete
MGRGTRAFFFGLNVFILGKNSGVAEQIIQKEMNQMED